MRITPLDIRKQDFRKVVRGFDGDEVRAFLALAADEYEAVLIDNKQLRERTADLDEKVQEYRTMEQTLRDTLMTAERVLTEARNNAAKEAELILRDAQLKADSYTEDFRRRAQDMRREIVDLNQEKDAYLARFRGLAEAQIRFIEDHKTDFEELDRRLMAHAQEVGQENSRLSTSLSSAVPPVELSDVSRPVASIENVTSLAGSADAAHVPAVPTPAAAVPANERDVWRDYDPAPSSSARTHAPEPSETRFAASRDEAVADEDVVPAAVDAIVHAVRVDDVAEVTDEGAVEQNAADSQEDAVVQEALHEEPEAETVTAGAAGEHEEAKRSSWDMESFTRGLGEM